MLYFSRFFIIIETSFSKEIFAKGGTNMNNADLVWRLVELLLQKEKDSNQVALDQAKNDNNPNDQRPDEV